LAHMLTKYNSKIKAGGKEATMAKIKMQLGTAFYMAAIGSTYAFNKGKGQRGEPLIFGGADTDIPGNLTGGKYEMMTGFGMQSNSIRIPDGKGGFYQFNLTGNDPIASMFSMAGNSAKFIESMMFDTGADHFFDSDSNFHAKFGERADKKNFNSLEAAQLLGGLIYSFGENLTNSTYLAGASNLFTDIQNAGMVMSGDMSQEGVKNAGKQWSLKFAKGFIPNWAKKTAKYTGLNSDYQKISNEWSTLIESQLYNKKLPNKYNIFGKKKKAFGFYTHVELSDVEKEVYRVMPKLNRTSNSLKLGGGVTIKMTADEQEFYQYHAGTLFNSNMEQLLKLPEYRNADVALQKIFIKKQLTAARSDASKLVKSDGSEDFKLSNGSIAPASSFYEDIGSRQQEIFLEKMISENDGDPFKDKALIDLNNQVNNQEEIIEANK